MTDKLPAPTQPAALSATALQGGLEMDSSVQVKSSTINVIEMKMTLCIFLSYKHTRHVMCIRERAFNCTRTYSWKRLGAKESGANLANLAPGLFFYGSILIHDRLCVIKVQLDTNCN